MTSPGRRRPGPRSAPSSNAATWLSPVRRDGTATAVRELPLDAELVILRRPIAGG